MTERGPNDLEQQIENLTKQKEYLQQQCRKAGKAILTLEAEKIVLKKDLDRLQEEYDNYKLMKENHDRNKDTDSN
jgi:chromosome segregation ATPase